MRTRANLATAFVLLAALLGAGPAEAGINTDVALTPPQGTVFLRSQYRGAHAVGVNAEADASGFRATAVYGFRQNLAIYASAAAAHQSMTVPGGRSSASGLTDLVLLARYRFVQADWVGGTARVALLIGGSVPTGQEPFGASTVTGTTAVSFTMRRGRWQVDADLQGTIVPESDGIDPGDQVRYDATLGYQIPMNGGGVSIVPLLEVNVETVSDKDVGGSSISGSGTSQVFLSPGIQIPLKGLMLEGSMQIPVSDDFQAPAMADDVRWGIGTLLRF